MALAPLTRTHPQLVKLEGLVRTQVVTFRKELPMRIEGTVRSSVSAAAASVAATQISKRLIAHGTVPAVLAGLAGAAAARSIAESGFQVGENLFFHRAWNDKLGKTAVDGLRRGSINGGLTMLATPLKKAMAARFAYLSPIKLAMATGAISGTIGGAAYSASNPDTWHDGAVKGFTRVAISTASGAAGGAVSSGVSFKVSGWAHGKFDKYIDFTAVGQNWIRVGGASGVGGAGGTHTGGILWNALFEHATPGTTP